MKYVPPTFSASGYHCPLCEVFARQGWVTPLAPVNNTYQKIEELRLSYCDHCHKFSLWHQEKLVYPEMKPVPMAHPDMPESVKVDYEEARSVFQDSPRSSAALLRLVIQKLCLELGQPGKNLNNDIGKLVEQGLSLRIQQSLDIVRVIGNNQVHPGVLDVRDDPSIAVMLFDLVNIIVDDRISRPKQVDELYAKLPETARKQIEERDA
jgi:hypothetical protein